MCAKLHCQKIFLCLWIVQCLQCYFGGSVHKDEKCGKSISHYHKKAFWSLQKVNGWLRSRSQHFCSSAQWRKWLIISPKWTDFFLLPISILERRVLKLQGGFPLFLLLLSYSLTLFVIHGLAMLCPSVQLLCKAVIKCGCAEGFQPRAQSYLQPVLIHELA